jgi:kynurenine formamidase
MRIIDLSQPVFHECPNCPTHPTVTVDMILDHGWDDWRLEKVSMSSHTGSHVDAPLHKIADGKSLDDRPLESYVGSAVIADLRDVPAVEALTGGHLKRRLPDDLKDRIVLLMTGWGAKRATSREWFYFSPFLAPSGAEWLVKQGTRAVGIDHYSIGGAREPEKSETHRVLLEAGLWIVEELNLPEEILDEEQPFEFWSLPINLRGFTGSFCRPVAVIHE